VALWWYLWYSRAERRAGKRDDGRPVAWEADRRHGFIGYEPPPDDKATPQPRFRLDGETAIEAEVARATPRELTQAVWRELDLYFFTQSHPESPAFSGGVWDEWPARDAQALADLKQEAAIIRAVQDAERRRRG
jgi:hypothetical protein